MYKLPEDTSWNLGTKSASVLFPAPEEPTKATEVPFLMVN